MVATTVNLTAGECFVMREGIDAASGRWSLFDARTAHYFSPDTRQMTDCKKFKSRVPTVCLGSTHPSVSE